MKVYVTLGGREFTVEIENDRAVVRAGGEEIPVDIVTHAGSAMLSAGAEVLVVPSRPEAGAAASSPLRVAFWGRAGGPGSETTLRLLVDGVPMVATVETENDRLRQRLAPAPRALGSVRISSPLPGVIRQVFVFPGNEVREGMPILTLEAMKMENEIRAEADGTLEALHVEEGQVVNTGDRLYEIRTSHGASS